MAAAYRWLVVIIRAEGGVALLANIQPFFYLLVELASVEKLRSVKVRENSARTINEIGTVDGVWEGARVNFS